MLKYTGCGLRNVWLQNGYAKKMTPYGEAVAIQDAEGLHRALAKAITRKPKMTGAEFRFIRKELDLSQAALGRMFGFEAQTIALWEKNRQRVPKLADRMLRLIYREHAEGNVKIRELIDRENDLDRINNETDKMIFVDTARGWMPKAAV
ncbi:MAG: transcriptional regulator [Burkholderiales bacterium]|nr:transcriptional regulator [Burkholderiales bacterium]